MPASAKATNCGGPGALVQKAPEFCRYESRLSLALRQDADDAVRVLLRLQAMESRFEAALTDDRDSDSRPQRRRFVRSPKGLPPFREGLEGSAARKDFVEQTPADPFRFQVGMALQQQRESVTKCKERAGTARQRPAACINEINLT